MYVHFKAAESIIKVIVIWKNLILKPQHLLSSNLFPCVSVLSGFIWTVCVCACGKIGCHT